jgi:hypothetical protein
MADKASLGGGEVVRVLGRTGFPRTVYDDPHHCRHSPNVLAVVGRQVGGAGPANPRFGVTACQLAVQNHTGGGVLTGEPRSVAQLRERLALCHVDEYSPLPATRPRRLRVRRPGGAGNGRPHQRLRTFERAGQGNRVGGADRGADVPALGPWQQTGECHATQRGFPVRAPFNVGALDRPVDERIAGVVLLSSDVLSQRDVDPVEDILQTTRWPVLGMIGAGGADLRAEP